MTKEKVLLYQKAYVELYEFIKMLTKDEQNKISESFINYIYNNRDKNYEFFIDYSKDLLEQDYMTETKALIVEMYEKYLAPEEEKEFWKNYDRICFNIIEEEKKKKYNSNDIFKNNKKESKVENISVKEENNINNEVAMIEYKESIFKRFINRIKNIFHKSV